MWDVDFIFVHNMKTPAKVACKKRVGGGGLYLIGAISFGSNNRIYMSN